MQQTHRRGDTCVARNTVAWNTAARNTVARNTGAPQSTHTALNAQPTRIRRRTTRLVNCAVPAPGVMNGAPTSYAAKQPTRNNVQPPQCNRRTVGATLVSPGTPPPVIPPPPIHTHAPPQRATRPSRRRTTRLVNCAVPAPGVMNGAPTSYAAKQPTRNNVQPPQCNRRTVGATLVSPGTPSLGTPPLPIHTHAPPHRATHPHPPTHNATGQLCRSGTGRHEWRPYELRRKTTDAKQRSAAAMQQTHRRGDTCVARNTAAWNTAAPIHTHTALNAQPDRSLSPAETRTGVTNVPLRRQKKRHPCP